MFILSDGIHISDKLAKTNSIGSVLVVDNSVNCFYKSKRPLIGTDLEIDFYSDCFQGVMSAAIDWGMLEAQYLGDEQYNQDIKKMLTMKEDV